MAEILGEKPTRNKSVLLMICTAWAAMIIFAFHACTHMVAAGDTWVAMACGRHFINHGVDTVEPFSYNSHKSGPTAEQLEKYPASLRPFVKKYMPEGWVNQNWLTQVIFYKLTTMFGSPQEPAYNALVVWKFVINLLIIISLYYSSRLLGAGVFVSAFLTCCAMYVSRSFIDIRPAVFSNMLVPLYLHILILTAYKNVRYVYLLVPVIVFWSNVHGGYLYAFMMIAPFWLIYLAGSKLKLPYLSPTPAGLVRHTFQAGLLAFIAMVIFNPYHLTNLTHTFIITVSEHAKEWKNVNEWHGAFKISNPVGNSIPFIVMLFTALVIAVFWFLCRNIKCSEAGKSSEQRYNLPAMPAAFIFIAAFTTFMAVSSRRFIPIAAYVMAPVLAMMLTQIWEVLTAARNGAKGRGFVPTQLSDSARCRLAVFSIIVLAGFAGVWAVKFNKVYLGPWPIDRTHTSIFMRMTASYAKPFDACEFIRANKLSGRMLNYWTEGGFVAFFQQPDEKTGEIPLKLFMDGRAQAAYNIETFQEYNGNILSGGELGKALIDKSNEMKLPVSALAEEMRQVSDYLDEKLASYNVWLILMPANQQNGLFMRAISSRPNWKMAYYDTSQVILVNGQTDKGKSLIDGIFTGTTIYPNENLRNIVMAGYYASQSPQKAWQLAYDSYNNTKSPAALSYLFGIRGSEYEEKTYNFCRSVIADYLKNEQRYRNEDGFIEMQSNAVFALNYVLRSASAREPDKARAYSQLAENLAAQRTELLKEYNW